MTNSQTSAGLSGVVVTLSGALGMQTVTDGSGNYSFTGLASGGNYTVSPSQNGFSLTPGSRTYQNLTANVTNANFAGVTVTPPSSGFPFSKTINYAYNNVGALAGVGTNLIGTDANNTTNVINSLSFKAFGAIKQLNYGNGLQLTMGYNANRQQPVSMKVGPNGTGSIIDYTYDYYDQNGHNNNRIRSITDGVDSAYSVSYTYDKWNRLTHATLGSASNVNSRYYTYDAFGNLRSAWRGDATYGGVEMYALNYAQNATTAPATNRILSVTENGGTQPFTYDSAGNLTQGDGMTYAYDAANRMTSVNNGGLGQYGYDGAGLRVKKVESGGTTYYVRSSKLGNTAFEVVSAGVQRAYVYANGQQIGEQSNDGQFYWLHTNHLGSTKKLTSTAGTVVYHGEFDTYGQAIYEWGSSWLDTKKFTGYERDAATGLDYAQARSYTGSRGRFLQPDPIGMKAVNQKLPQSLNRYSYVQNDPVNYFDKTGTLLASSRCWSVWYHGMLAGYTCNENAGLDVADLPIYDGGTGNNNGDRELRQKPHLWFSVNSNRPARPLNKCGGFDYAIDWHLSGGYNSQDYGQVNGWVVQHITIESRIYDEKTGKLKYPPFIKDYYEAWQVINGGFIGTIDGSTDTYASLANQPGTWGVITWRGSAKFVWEDELGPDPSKWSGTLVVQSGGLPATFNKPAGWSEFGTIRHDASIDWNCTSNNSRDPIYSPR